LQEERQVDETILAEFQVIFIGLDPLKRHSLDSRIETVAKNI